MSSLQVSIQSESTTAPFEQVRTQIATAVANGQLSAGTKLPTVRRLAADLGLSANTVARAYRELEADGVLATHGRRGTFVRSDVVDEPAARSGTGDIPDTADTADIAEVARASAAEYVHTLRRLGLSSHEALRLVENAWNRD